jgi:hypothetical protein
LFSSTDLVAYLSKLEGKQLAETMGNSIFLAFSVLLISTQTAAFAPRGCAMQRSSSVASSSSSPRHMSSEEFAVQLEQLNTAGAFSKMVYVRVPIF